MFFFRSVGARQRISDWKRVVSHTGFGAIHCVLDNVIAETVERDRLNVEQLSVTHGPMVLRVENPTKGRWVKRERKKGGGGMKKINK